MKKIKIDFCESNVQYRSRAAFETLRQRKGLLVREWGCLGNCELCDEAAYAFVGDAMIHAPTAEELLRKVEEKLSSR